MSEGVTTAVDEANTANVDLFSVEHLCEHARNLAHRLVVAQFPSNSTCLFSRIKRSAHEITAAHKQLTTAGSRGDSFSRDAEWLLDNYYVVEEQLHQIEDDLPHRYCAELPKLETGEPRVYQIASELILHTDGLLDEATIVRFIQAFQECAPLRIGEVWAVPIMLRVGLIEHLGRLAVEMRHCRQQRDEVRKILEAWSGGPALPDVLQTAQDQGLLAQALMLLDDCSAEDLTRLAPLERLLLELNPALHDRVRECHQRQAASQISIGNVITAMRLLSALDWVAFFEQCSLVELILRKDPSQTYALMDYDSRDRYRHALEHLARGSDASEIELAKSVVAHAEQVPRGGPLAERRRHVGYWLVDDGRRTLEAEFNYRPTLQDITIRSLTARGLLWYIGAIFAITAGGTLAALSFGLGDNLQFAAVLAFPAALAISDVAVGMVNYLISRMVPPRVLPKLEMRDGITPDCRTIVVVPSMLGSSGEISELLKRLELHYVANPDAHLAFALLTDFADAGAESLDVDRALIDEARAGIVRLNLRYGTNGLGPFYLFHRKRLWNPQEGRWIGWERKRGKLMEFNRLLRGARDTNYFVQEGDLDRLVGSQAFPVRFVITCDADTQLPYGVARRLIGTLAHPLNRPCFLEGSDQVYSGYSLIQPRVSVALSDARKSWFVRIRANSRGIDPYATAASDVYQDLFGEGSFTGKGIYDLAAFERCLKGAFRENQILSHDLIEGCHVRTALASDIEVIDGYPMRYDADARRQHRWVRGDWQIAPWLWRRVPAEQGLRQNRLTWLSWWKIADNLRRSLVPPAISLTMILGWYWAPSIAWLWSLVGLASLGTPVCIAMIAGLEDLSRARDWSTGMRGAAASLWTAILQLCVLVVSLPHRAALMIDAIGRTLWRMLISRRLMLEWQTAAATDRVLNGPKWSSTIQLGSVSALAAIMGVTLPYPALSFAAPWLLAWMCSPLILEGISRPCRIPQVELDLETRRWLRQIARRSWNYFEQNLGPQNHWLPPDNVQEYPSLRTADRLSPTNEGLFLVSVLAARDFGFLGLHGVLGWWEKNLESLCQLPKAGGHFLNWYDTTTMQPLRPRYLSTVDSGNLAASLLVVRQGITELRDCPVLSNSLWDGLADTVLIAEQEISTAATAMPSQNTPVDQEAAAVVRILRRLCAQPPEDLSDWPRSVSVLRTCGQQLKQCLGGSSASRNESAGRVAPDDGGLQVVARWIDGFLQDYDGLYSWIDIVARADQSQDKPSRKAVKTQSCWHAAPECRVAWSQLKAELLQADSLSYLQSLEERISSPIAALRTALALSRSDSQAISVGRLWIAEFTSCVHAASQRAAEIGNRLENVSQCVQKLIEEMDFEPLYDPLRRLFSIGYNLDEGRLDGSYYDLLCSEARLSSYLAIAKGDVPVNHWFRLGRQTTYASGQIGLLSWGGTMFEFLMPLLFQPRIEGSLLSAACETAVAQQQNYARQRGVPWGVSESAFASLSPNADYQYQSFGVPGIGLKRGLSKDNVIAPYATMLALEIDPGAAVRNLRLLERHGLLARWGFYEAIDFTPSRLPSGRQSAPVRCFMAHHQGMSFLSLANLLNNDAIRRRFRADPLMKAAELLLQEGVPVSSPVMLPHADEVADVRIVRLPEQPVVSRHIETYDTPTPRAHLLSNGSYAVMLTNAGGGYSRWREISISRWRSDATRDHWGQWMYLSDARNGHFWSATYQPTLIPPDEYDVIFSIDKAEYRRRDGEMESSLEVAISPEDSMEVRQLKLTNLGKQTRVMDVTSYVEVVLTQPAADLAHPAFQKLFVETEYIPESQALLARRRPRDSEETVLWAVHVFCTGDSKSDSLEFETSRARFLGRGRSPQNPQALRAGQRLSGTTGAVLDPIFAFRCRVNVPAEGRVHVAMMTGFAATRDEALRLADLYHDWRTVQRAFELAWAYNQMELRHWRVTAAQTHRFQRLASTVLFPSVASRGRQSALFENRLTQRDLWPFGISGDRPIVLVRVDQSRQLIFIRELLVAQEFWAYRQFHVDLVILNCLPGSYLDELQEQLERLVRETPRRAEVRPGRAFVLRCAQLSPEQLQLFETVASVVIEAARGWSSPVLQPRGKTETTVPAFSRNGPSRSQLPGKLAPATFPLTSVNRPLDQPGTAHLEYWNGFGGFADEGREYHINPNAAQMTPMPWCNVIANQRFGCLVTETGAGYTWAVNSRENKLTTWCNDPVADAPSEQLYLQDGFTQDVWQLFGGFVAAGVTRNVQHGCGWSRWNWASPGLRATITVSVAADDPVKFIEVELHNDTGTPKELGLTYYAEFVLGVCREETQIHLVTEVDPTSHALLIRNSYHPDFQDQIAFLQVLAGCASVAGDRTEFLGRNGDPAYPVALASTRLSGNVGPGLDPCGAVRTQFQLGAHQSTTATFLLGRGANRTETKELLERYSRPAVVVQAHEESRDRWEAILDAIQVETPNRAFDLLVNRWLIYQTLSCRIWGRTGYYQASGAYGFRDQLQDVMALVYARPDLVREHLLRAAARQYLEGDVQHWWHVPSGRGTRTRFSDDLLWLILAACHYVDVTQDETIWDEQVSFLESPQLSPDEHERYELPQVSRDSGSLYEHCLRALRHGFQLGPHGLPLIGCGDWNDGMNQVGPEGRGESIWVGWFLIVIIDRFLPVLEKRDDHCLAADYRAKRAVLSRQLERHGWDGEWYRRAFFDDGSPLGSQSNSECQIDSLAQSWAVFAQADADRTARALDAVVERLVRPKDHLVALLTPPFDHSTPNPGYIAGYLKGVRENGGQYTHAVLWLIQALTAKGDSDRAFAIFDLINPIRQAATPQEVARYHVEPYVMAADVYSEVPHVGRGGWTWYTGSASWTYRTALENILGLQLRGRQISFRPCVPTNWGHFEVSLRVGESLWRFHVEMSDHAIEATTEESAFGGTLSVDLVDDGEDHDVKLCCRRRSAETFPEFVETRPRSSSTGVGSGFDSRP